VKFRLSMCFFGPNLDRSAKFAAQSMPGGSVAHKVERCLFGITGEGAIFDSRVVHVSETGPKDDRANGWL